MGHRRLVAALAAVVMAAPLGLGSCDSTLRSQIELYVDGCRQIQAEGIVYVDGTHGDDANPGTRDLPKQTIQNAIDLADELLDTGEVRVAEGTYQVHETILVRTGISICGGYSPSDWSREIDQYTTELRGSGVETVIKVGSGAGIETAIDGFTIVTGSGISTADDDLVVGVRCEDASPRISNNVIDATDVPEDGAGISNQRSSPTIVNNYIYFGSSFEYSWAVLNSRSSPKIWNNVIFAGESATGSSTGIANQLSSSPSIQNNTIHGGESATSIGVYNLSTGSVIENNIILAEGTGTSWCIYEESLGILEKLRHNDFWEGDFAYVYGPVSTRVFYSLGDLASLESDLGDKSENNVALDPIFNPGGDGWHLSDSSPVAVKQGGDDNLAEIPDTDKDGNPRTSPWSIGAYEKD